MNPVETFKSWPPPKRWLLVTSTAAVLLLVAFGLMRRQDESKQGESVTDPQSSQSDSVLVLDSTAQRLAGIEVETVSEALAGALIANGTIAFNENQVSIVAPRAEGRVVAVRADLGQAVARGTPLAVLASAEISQIRGDYERARAGLDIAQRNYEREKRLFQQSISPEKEMLAAEQSYRETLADVKSSASRLASIGASEGQGGNYTLGSPIAGIVVDRTAMPGQIAGPQTNLFTVANLRHVWITVDVYDADLARVQQGAVTTVTAAALPGENFIGRVTYAGGVVDPNTRTFKVRVEVENPRLRLRPGMFAQVRIEAPSTADPNRVVVPDIAVQDVNGAKVVFVAGAQRGTYIVRPVSLGLPVDSGRVSVITGLRAGERVVVRGAFQLKAQFTKASFGEEE